MNLQPIRARQPPREPWPLSRLVHERALAMSYAIDPSTQQCYDSACNSYLTFVHAHDLPVDPTPDTLSFYVVYMSHHISPRSVRTYLSGIVSQLEPYFPNIRDARSSRLVQRTLKGCLKLQSSPVSRKRALTLDDLYIPLARYQSSTLHDDLLFLSMCLTAFFGLMRLGELTFPTDEALRDWRKVTRRSSVSVTHEHYGFFLPAHKADRFFEGNRILIWGERFGFPTRHVFLRYLSSRDHLFASASPLWLMASGAIPSRAFFLGRLRALIPDSSVGGQSLRAGGATALAESGAAPHIIQAAGRWASETFQIYIRQHPILLHALLFPSAPLGAHVPRPLAQPV